MLFDSRCEVESDARVSIAVSMGRSCLFVRSHSSSAAGPVQSWITSTDEHGIVAGLEQQPDLVFGGNTEDSVPAIHVDEKVTYQRMEGGGAALTDGAAWLINEKLSPVQRDEVMKRLFDPVAGIGVSFLRNPIGSSDMTRRWYTLDDNQADRADPSLPHFSIDHDLVDIIPLTQTARKLNPRLTLMINAWSPPAWMKRAARWWAATCCHSTMSTTRTTS